MADSPRRYIIGKKEPSQQPSPVRLSDLAKRFAAAEGAGLGIKLLRVLGQEHDPGTLVVEMPEEEAERLRQEYGRHLVIEKDEPLSIEPPPPTFG